MSERARTRSEQETLCTQRYLAIHRAADALAGVGHKEYHDFFSGVASAFRESVRRRWYELDNRLPAPSLSFEEWRRARGKKKTGARDPQVARLLALGDWAALTAEFTLYTIASGKDAPSVGDLNDQFWDRVDSLGLREEGDGLLVVTDEAASEDFLVTEDGSPIVTEDGERILVSHHGSGAPPEQLALELPGEPADNERLPDNTPYRGFTPTPSPPPEPQPDPPAQRPTRRLRIHRGNMIQAIITAAGVITAAMPGWTVTGVLVVFAAFVFGVIKESPLYLENVPPKDVASKKSEPTAEKKSGRLPRPRVRVATPVGGHADEVPVGGQADEDEGQVAARPKKGETDE